VKKTALPAGGVATHVISALASSSVNGGASYSPSSRGTMITGPTAHPGAMSSAGGHSIPPGPPRTRRPDSAVKSERQTFS
jgi:hypothetical protein